MKEPLKVYEAFAGKGTFSEAFVELNIPHEIVGYCEIDKYASTAFATIHNVSEDLNGWDITTINPNELPDFDVFTHGSPCTSFSRAGKEDGGDKDSGTESSLIWYSVEIIKIKRPSYVLWENVSAVLNKKHKHNFDEYINTLKDLGYNSYWNVSNSLEFGIPQNRERIYVFSIREDEDAGDFKFINSTETKESLINVLEYDAEPPIYHNIYGGFGETKARVFKEYSPTIRTAKGGGHIPSVKLKDIMEENVDDKYLLSDNMINYINGKNNKNHNFRVAINEPDGVLQSPIRAQGDKPVIIEDFYKSRDFRTYDEYSPTLRSTRTGLKVVNGERVRYLTPLECWRLMDETDENFYKVKKALNEKFYKGKDRSDTQLYKIAGNAIVKRVLVEYFKVLFKEYIK